MLDTIYYGNKLADWGISLLIIMGVLILNKMLILFNKYIFKKIASKSKNKIDDVLFNTLEKPVLSGLTLAAIWIATNRINLDSDIQQAISMAYRILIVLNITWFFARFSTGLMEEYIISEEKSKTNKRHFDQRLLPLLKRAILIVIWIIGIVMALNNVGIKVTTLLGTLGIGGIALALAAQDTIKNILGGITIFTDQTFRIGDIIRLDSTEGTVEDIGLRSTRIRTYEKRIVVVPNYKLIDAFITNISEESARRVVVKLGLTYDTNHEQMQKALEILKEISLSVQEVVHKDTSVVFSEFGDSALVITYTYFIRKKSDIKEVSSVINFEILRTFNEAKLNFAFPSQTIYIGAKNESV
jgi:MscS family membrane protein